MSDRQQREQPEKTHRLTLRESRVALVVSLVACLTLSALGLVELRYGNKMYAGAFCLFALSQLFNVPSRWKDYRIVKQGAEVYIPAQIERPAEAPVPKAVSFVVVLVLSGFVGTVSIVIVLAAHISFNTLTGWSVASGILLFLWLSTAYCWHRVLTDMPQGKPVQLAEQPEGVWPPAPLIAVEEDNKG